MYTPRANIGEYKIGQLVNLFKFVIIKVDIYGENWCTPTAESTWPFIKTRETIWKLFSFFINFYCYLPPIKQL